MALRPLCSSHGCLEWASCASCTYPMWVCSSFEIARRCRWGRHCPRGCRRSPVFCPAASPWRCQQCSCSWRCPPGVAPVEVSSGEVVRHRLSLAGNRRLNWALHMIAINQARYKGQGGSYYRKKVAEGKTHREAMRCLKRRVSDAVFKKLMLDLEEAA